MNQTEKQVVIDKLSTDLAKAGSLVLADYTNMTVAQADLLRGKFFQAGAKYVVVKNTLLKRAVKGTAMEVIASLCEGPTAVGLGFDAPSVPAKILGDFAKDNPDRCKIKGGYLGGKLLDQKGVSALATMPALPELRSMLLGLILAPAQKLLAQINAPSQQVVGVNQARVDKGGATGEEKVG